MLVKGSMNKGKYPIVKIDSKNIQFVESYKYLDVTLDTRLNFVPHMKATKEKVIKLANTIRRIVKEDWGLKRRTIEIFYKSLFLPIITYGSIAWHDKVDKQYTIKQLNSREFYY